MKRHEPVLFFALMLIVVACNTTTTAKSPLALQPAGEAWGALYQQQAAEYKALCFQAYNIARLRLDQRLSVRSKKPLAIITDIDETVLDNSPYFSKLAREGKVYSDSSWINWTDQVMCDTVPGAYKFLKYASAKGVAVFYITNRFQRELLSTVGNLRKWKLPNADTTHVLLLNSNDNSKESRRLSVEKEHEIILLIGDNLGDFNQYFDHLNNQERSLHAQTKADLFGRTFVVLPNSMYGNWEDVFYKGQHVNSLQKQNQILLNNLK